MMRRTIPTPAALAAALASPALAGGLVTGAAPSTAGNPWHTCPADPQPGVDHYYPAKAQRLNVNGQTLIQCRVDRTGHVIACTWISEDPTGYDFGLASSRIACLIKLKPMESAPPEGVLVNIPVRMKVPDR